LNRISETDDDLVRRTLEAGEADLRAFETLVKRYQAKVVSNCRHITRDLNYAEDLAQEVFVKAFFHLNRFEGRSSFKTWLQKIKVNHCLNHIKAQQGKVFVDVEDKSLMNSADLAIQPIAEAEVIAQFDREQLRAILDSMPDTLRLPLILRDMDEFSYEEVANMLGISLSAAKMRIKRAREAFRILMRDAATSVDRQRAQLNRVT
jgi:RNA polymerase sigma-70 factor (ECF subfamily)